MRLCTFTECVLLRISSFHGVYLTLGYVVIKAIITFIKLSVLANRPTLLSQIYLHVVLGN